VALAHQSNARAHLYRCAIKRGVASAAGIAQRRGQRLIACYVPWLASSTALYPLYGGVPSS